MRLIDARSFGAIDADADELLAGCFQNHEAYLEARDLSRFLILGRKGSGKTAIYKRLVETDDYKHFAIGHSFDDYPWQHHQLQQETGVPEERRYFHSWKFLILMGLSKLALNRDQSLPLSDQALASLQAIESFVVDSYGTRDPDFSNLFSPERELRFKTTLGVPFLQVTGESLHIRELPLHIQDVNRAIENHLLAVLNPDHTYFVCFDQLDLGFSALSQDYSQRLIGLILAARDVFLRARDAGCRISVPVFLRDDIFHDLQFEDKNKITENFTSWVRWGVHNGLTLQALMERRFGEVLGAPGGGDTIAWNAVFDESREMPSRQTKYHHITDRTFLRPRDMIKFCNSILDEYRKAGGTEDGLFDNNAIHLARETYSDYLLSELDDEIAKHVPQYKEYLEVLKEVGSMQFSLEEFAQTFSRRPALGDTDPKEALNELFEFSVVGYLKPGGRGGGSEYVWRYLDPRARFNPTADPYRVHPGLKEALDLTKGTS